MRTVKRFFGFSDFFDEDLDSLSTQELLALMRHEVHRIEKAVYNDLLEKKQNYHARKRDRVKTIFNILVSRNFDMSEPTVSWAKEIIKSFDNLYTQFILPSSQEPYPYRTSRIRPFMDFLKERRSVRSWSQDQPSTKELEEVAISLIEAASWAPNSGDRQAWRFMTIVSQDEKNLLEGLKEIHCISAPLMIFIGMDKRVYGAFGPEEISIYLDAGAAIMQMILTAHDAGLGTCWNHLGRDLIDSRKENREKYNTFAKKLCVPSWIEPIAILCVGLPRIVPPTPARMNVSQLILRETNSSHNQV
jgi:nitroreductase